MKPTIEEQIAMLSSYDRHPTFQAAAETLKLHKELVWGVQRFLDSKMGSAEEIAAWFHCFQPLL